MMDYPYVLLMRGLNFSPIILFSNNQGEKPETKPGKKIDDLNILLFFVAILYHG